MFPLDYMRRIRLLQAPDAATALHCPSVPLRASGLKSRPMPASCGVAGEDIGHGYKPVSYTHLDVYKRQYQGQLSGCIPFIDSFR